jgi:hypothetical protein
VEITVSFNSLGHLALIVPWKTIALLFCPHRDRVVVQPGFPPLVPRAIAQLLQVANDACLVDDADIPFFDRLLQFLGLRLLTSSSLSGSGLT